MCLIYLSWNKLTHYFNHCDLCLNRTTLALFCFFWNDQYHKCKIVHNSAIFTITGADPGFGQGRAPASEAESCRHSEAELRKQSEHSATGVQGPLKGPGSFWVFDAQICILTHSRDSFSLIFDIYFDTKS